MAQEFGSEMQSQPKGVIDHVVALRKFRLLAPDWPHFPSFEEGRYRQPASIFAV